MFPVHLGLSQAGLQIFTLLPEPDHLLGAALSHPIARLHHGYPLPVAGEMFLHQRDLPVVFLDAQQQLRHLVMDLHRHLGPAANQL